MDLTTKVLLAMCVQGIVGIFVSFYINETIGLVIMLLAAGVNSLIVVFLIVEIFKSKTIIDEQVNKEI